MWKPTVFEKRKGIIVLYIFYCLAVFNLQKLANIRIIEEELCKWKRFGF